MYFIYKCCSKSEEDIFRGIFFGIFSLDEGRHQEWEILFIKWKEYSRNGYGSDFCKDIFDHPLMNCYSSSYTCISRFFDKSVCLVEGFMEIWIIIHISETIGVSKKCDTWWWNFFVGIEIPIIIVDIIPVVIQNISFIESEWEYWSRKSSIGSYLITILIEYNISLWVRVAEHIQDIFLIIQSPIEETCNKWKSFSDFLHSHSSLPCWNYASIDLSSVYEFCSSLFKGTGILFEPIRWICYSEWFKRKYIFCSCSIGEWILSIFFDNGARFSFDIWYRLSDHIESSRECESPRWDPINGIYSIKWNPRKRSQQKIGSFKISTGCTYSISDGCRISHSSKTLQSWVSMTERICYIGEKRNTEYDKSSYSNCYPFSMLAIEMIDSLRHTTSDESIWKLSCKKIGIRIYFWIALFSTNVNRSVWNIERRNEIECLWSWHHIHESSLPERWINYLRKCDIKCLNSTKPSNADNRIFWKIYFFVYTFSFKDSINELSMTSQIERSSLCHRKNTSNIEDTSLSGLYVETGGFFGHLSTCKIGFNYSGVYIKRYESKYKKTQLKWKCIKILFDIKYKIIQWSHHIIFGYTDTLRYIISLPKLLWKKPHLLLIRTCSKYLKPQKWYEIEKEMHS